MGHRKPYEIEVKGNIKGALGFGRFATDHSLTKNISILDYPIKLLKASRYDYF